MKPSFFYAERKELRMYMGRRERKHERQRLQDERFKFFLFAEEDTIDAWLGFVPMTKKRFEKVLDEMARLRCYYLAVNFIRKSG